MNDSVKQELQSIFDTISSQYKALEYENKNLKTEVEKLKSELAKLKGEEIEEENCSICIDKIKNKFKLPCGHEFCIKCIHTWGSGLAKKFKDIKCPICRADFDMSIFKSAMCECGQLFPSGSHVKSIKHNKYLYTTKYRYNLKVFLDKEFDRLFISEFTSAAGEDGIGRLEFANFDAPYCEAKQRVSRRISFSVIKKIGSTSEDMRCSIVDWIKGFILRKYDVRGENGYVIFDRIN